MLTNIFSLGTIACGKPFHRLQFRMHDYYIGFTEVTLAPGESRSLTIDIDPKLLGDWVDDSFRVAGGTYAFAVGRSALEPVTTVSSRIPAFRISSNRGRP